MSVQGNPVFTKIEPGAIVNTILNLLSAFSVASDSRHKAIYADETEQAERLVEQLREAQKRSGRKT